MMLNNTSIDLIEKPLNNLSHVVILGAGASLAAFPQGDANGKPLPLMNNLVETLELGSLLEAAGVRREEWRDFEKLYSDISENPNHAQLAEEINSQISMYFSALKLPLTATIYDRLLLGLRSCDAVFSFNWDPFLFDAYERNCHVVNLPSIHFLHGNVRQPQSPLLYPVAKKDYTQHVSIATAWEQAKQYLGRAHTMTIFGYAAPKSDEEAVELLRGAWLRVQNREMLGHVHIINIANSSALYESWSAFTPTNHLDFITSFDKSRIHRWPRRSSEMLYYAETKALPSDTFPFPQTDNLEDIQEYVVKISRYE